MLAMVLTGQAPIETHPLRAVDRPVPEPGPRDLLVRVAACGICRTDLHLAEGDLPLVRSPIVPGHQVVGVVTRAGQDAVRFRAGDRVGIAWLRSTCGDCDWCRSGRENLCPVARFTGWHEDGGYAEYAVVPDAYAYAIPPDFADAEAAPLLCAGIIGYRALRLSAVPAGGRLGLYGFGSSAHVTLQIAVGRGCEVYVCTRDAGHRELARLLGAAWTGDVRERMPHAVDGAIVFAPAGDVVPLALGNVAAGGTVALAGIYMSTIPPLDHADLYRERRLTTVTASTRADGDELLAEAARVRVRPQVTRFPFVEASAALAALKSGAIRGSGVLVPASSGARE